MDLNETGTHTTGLRLEAGTRLSNRFTIKHLLQAWPSELTGYGSEHKLLGVGTFGETYLATDDESEKLVAVKIFKNSKGQILKKGLKKIGNDKERLAMASRECSLAQKIQDMDGDENGKARFMRCIYDGTQLGDDEKVYHIVFEFLGQTNLLQRLTNEPLDFDEFLRVFKMLLEGLALIGEHLVHRDIKLENIMIFPDQDGNLFVKYIDFGLVIEANQFGASEQGGGSAFTMAPEVWFTKNYVPRSPADVYSLGASMYDLIFDGAYWSNCYEIVKKSGKVDEGDKTEEQYERELVAATFNYVKNQAEVQKKNPCSEQSGEDEWYEAAQLICNEMMVYEPSKRKTASEVLSNALFSNVNTGVPNLPDLPEKQRKEVMAATQDNFMDILNQLEGKKLDSAFALEDTKEKPGGKKVVRKKKTKKVKVVKGGKK